MGLVLEHKKKKNIRKISLKMPMMFGSGRERFLLHQCGREEFQGALKKPWCLSTGAGQTLWDSVWLSAGKCKRLPSAPKSWVIEQCAVNPKDQTRTAHARGVFRLGVFCNVGVSEEITKASMKAISLNICLTWVVKSQITAGSVQKELRGQPSPLSLLPLYFWTRAYPYNKSKCRRVS